MPHVNNEDEVSTSRDIWGKDFPIGGEWDAGLGPERPGSPRGRWTVSRTEGAFVLVFHRIPAGVEETLATFLPTQYGEVQAKTYARTQVEQAWKEA